MSSSYELVEGIKVNKVACAKARYNVLPALAHVVNQRLAAVYMLRLLEVIRDNGIDISPILQQVGLDFDRLRLPGATCTVGERLQVLDLIAQKSPIPGLGLMVGTRIMIHDHGIVGYAILSSSKLVDAMNIIARFHQLSNPTVRCTYHVEGDDVVVTEASISPFDSNARIYHLEEMLGAWIPIGALLQQGRFEFTEVRVPWGKPAHSHIYEMLFQCEIKYGQVDCTVRFPKHLLKAPVCLSSPETALLCEHQCNILASERMGVDDIVHDVRRILFSRPGRLPLLEEVAQLLSLSPRTLRRKLQASGTSFRETLDGLRIDIARKYLANTQIPIKSVAFLLGYGEPTNFHRAFKRCVGMTPQLFRTLNAKTD